MTAQTDAGGTGRIRNRRGEGGKLRDVILDAAQALLEESGDESAVTIRAVTRRAGVVPQSFYLQFPSLSALLFALYIKAFESLQQSLVEARDDSAEPYARLEALSTAYLDFALRNPGPYRALMSSRGRVHEEWDTNDLPGAEAFALLRDCVRAVRTAKPLAPVELHVKTTLLWTQLHGLASLMLDRPTFPWPPLEALVSDLVTDIAS